MIFILQTWPQRTVFVAPPTSFVASAPNEDFGAERCPDFRLGPAAAGPHGWTQIPSWAEKGMHFDVGMSDKFLL